MVNISIGQQLISLPDASEATPMPRPLSVPLRQEIVRRRQQGLPLTRSRPTWQSPMARSGTSGGCTADTIARDWLPTIAPVVVRSPSNPGTAPHRLRSQAQNTPSGCRADPTPAPQALARSRPPLGSKSPTRLRPSRSQSAAAAPPCRIRRGPPSSPTPRDLASRRRRECAVSHRPAHLLADGDR